MASLPSHLDDTFDPAVQTVQGTFARIDTDGGPADDEVAALLPNAHPWETQMPSAHPRRKFILILICLLAVLAEFGEFVALPAITQIFEDNVCRRHYGLHHDASSSGDLTGLDCKIDSVTKEVSLLIGIADMMRMIPSAILAIPYGVLADRIGRKPVFAMALVAVLINETWTRIILWWWATFPPRLVWCGPVAFILGGGQQVANSLIFTLLADVFPVEQHANVFFILFSCVLVAAVCGAPVGAALTATKPWDAYSISYPMIALGCSLLVFLPETLPVMLRIRKRHGNQDSTHVKVARLNIVLGRHMIYLLETAHESMRFIWRSTNIMLLLFIFIIGNIGKQSLAFVVLYGSRKFRWSISKAANLITLALFSNLVAFMVLPLITKLIIRRWSLTSTAKDLALSRSQNVILAGGMLMMGLSKTPWVLLAGIIVFGLGGGYAATIRSLITSLVHQNHYATLFTTISLLQSIGSIIAGPMQAGLFNRGITLGGYWLGMPFLIAAGLYAFGSLGFLFVRLPEEDECIEE